MAARRNAEEKENTKTAAEPEQTETAAEPEQTETAAEPEQEQKKSAWDEMVSVLVPRAHKGEDQEYYVCVNSRRFYIPRNGKTQKMPRPIAEALQASIEAEFKAEEFAESIEDRKPEQPAV